MVVCCCAVQVEEAEEGPRPFYCLLDAGLKKTSTGSKTFGALKVQCREEEGRGVLRPRSGSGV
jgi:hypothetical protein